MKSLLQGVPIFSSYKLKSGVTVGKSALNLLFCKTMIYFLSVMAVEHHT
jgi:hypothetical protein